MRKNKIVLIISYFLITVSIVGAVVLMLTKPDWKGSIQHSIISMCFFLPLTVILNYYRKKANNAVRIILLIIIIHILLCSGIELIALIHKLLG